MLLSCLLLVALVSAACGSGKTDSGALTDNETSKSAGPSDGEKGTSSRTETTELKPNGREIKILLSHAEAQYAKQAREDDIYIQELSRLSGYKLKYEFLGHSDYAQQLTLRFASGELGDLVRTPSIISTIHTGAVEQGAFLELGPLIDRYAPELKELIPESAWNSPRVSYNGKIYGIPVMNAVTADRVVFIRQDWLDKLNMPQPVTVEDYLAFFEAVKREDMNGNGDPNDEYGIGMFDNLGWGDIFSAAFGATPGKYTWRDGQLIPDIIDPKMKDVILFYKSLYDNGYVNPNLFTRKEAEHNAAIAKGEIGLWGAAVYQYTAGYNPDGAKNKFVNEPNAAVSMIAAPKGPDGKGGLGLENDGIYFVWVIPSKTKNPEDILNFLRWAWTSPEADRFFAYGIEGHNYTIDNGKVVFDISNEVNADKNAFQMFQLSLNVRENGLSSKLVLEALKDADTLLKGYETAKENMLKNDALHMPSLKALEGKPELAVGFGSGSLFTDMFAKVVTGGEPIDSAFDRFVAEWRSRGGDEVIKEATEWYKKFHNLQ
jgi:putative aldouronate transport system substrate-binding protein